MNKFKLLGSGIWILIGAAIVWSSADDIKKEYERSKNQ